MHRRYLLAFVLFLLPVAGLAALNVLYLRNTGEFVSIPEVVERQQNDPDFCIYGTALHDDTFSYKQATYAQKKPDVVVVGSSLTMEFRERFFRESFYNMGGTMDSIVNGKHSIASLVASHPPKVLLLGIDWWWFRAGVDPYQRSRPPVENDRFTAEKIFRPLSWLWNGKISLGEYLKTAAGQSGGDACAIGVQSKENRRGFAPDGSYYYTSLITGAEATEPAFAPERTAIADASGRFEADTELNPTSVQDFIEMIRDLEAKGITVVLFFQPIAPTVWAAMQEKPEQYAYIGKLLRTLSEEGIRYENFLDANTLGSPDCEFIDGLHGGDVTYARLLRELHDHTADPEVRSLLALDTINATIVESAGLAQSPDPRVTTLPETDFLQLGCVK